MEYLDRSVGIILNTLKRLKIEDNTIIVFTSDNGPLVHRDEELENCYGKCGFTDESREHLLREGGRLAVVPTVVAAVGELPREQVQGRERSRAGAPVPGVALRLGAPAWRRPFSGPRS